METSMAFIAALVIATVARRDVVEGVGFENEKDVAARNVFSIPGTLFPSVV